MATKFPKFSQALAQDPATRRIWYGVATAHDLESHDGMTEESLYQKIFASHFGHLAIIFLWTSGNLFHVAWQGNFQQWVLNPLKVKPIAHAIWDPHFGAELVEDLNLEVDALIEARQLTVEQVENVARVLFQNDVSKVTTAELRRDILIFAKQNPGGFMNLLKDPALKFNATIQNILDKNLIQLRNSKKEVWFNTASNKKKMCNIPYGEDPLFIIASYFESDDGLESYKHLKELAKNS